MASADIDIGAHGISARATTKQCSCGQTNTLELVVQGRSEPISVRLHFTNEERLSAAVDQIKNLVIQKGAP